ncbi:MAG: OadG family protein [Bacteroidetes bacterium]|nr:OadG family protein [Bacteroidota bacterium]
MTWTDALLITAMGMGVTFIGLILTNVSINLFGQLIKLRRGPTPEPATAVQPATTVAPAVEVPSTLTPEVLSVIIAVLAIEIKLARSYRASRFTFKSQEQSQGWSGEGRLIVNPYQRGRI